MEEDEDGEEKGENDEEDDANKKMSVSLDDLNDALNDDVGAATTTTDNDSESDFKECSSGAYGEELRCQHIPMPPIMPVFCFFALKHAVHNRVQ